MHVHDHLPPTPVIVLLEEWKRRKRHVVEPCHRGKKQTSHAWQPNRKLNKPHPSYLPSKGRPTSQPDMFWLVSVAAWVPEVARCERPAVGDLSPRLLTLGWSAAARSFLLTFWAKVHPHRPRFLQWNTCQLVGILVAFFPIDSLGLN